MKGNVTCSCGHSWSKSDSSKKDVSVCHICGKDNTMKDGGWLDKYNDGGPVQPNYNDSSVSASLDFQGDGYSNVGRNYSPAWGGQFKEGGPVKRFMQPTETFKNYGYNPIKHEMSTELSTSIGGPGEVYLVPGYRQGKILQDPEGVFNTYGEHLGGPFKTVQAAEDFGKLRHQYVEKNKDIPAPFKTRDYAMGGEISQVQNDTQSSTDSVRHQANKILQYEQLRGGPGGAPLPQYKDPKYMNMLMENVYPEVKKIMPNASAMESGEAMDFIFNAGWDKTNNKISKDPRAFALQEYYRQNDSSKLDQDGKWSGRKNAPYSFDQEYSSTIGKLPENERRLLMNKGRDWYYQNTAPKGSTWDLKTQGAHPDYKDTWYGRIWNTNDYKPFDPNNPKFTPKKEMGGSIPGAVGFTYARTNDPAPSEGKYAKKTMASAENGAEMEYYQNGLDWKPRSMDDGGVVDTFLDPIINAGKSTINYFDNLVKTGIDKLSAMDTPTPVSVTPNKIPKKVPVIPKKDTYDSFRDVYDKSPVWDNLTSLYDKETYSKDKNRIKLNTGRFTGANVSSSLINDLAEAAKRNNIPVGQLLTLAGRESTFGEDGNWSRHGDSKEMYTSGWDVADQYFPYDERRFLADKKVPGISVVKDSHGWEYNITDKKAAREYVNKNPQLLDQYKKKLDSTPSPGNRNLFDLSAEFLKKKGIKGYNPGDPRYEEMFQKDYDTLKQDKALMSYLKKKGYTYEDGGQLTKLDQLTNFTNYNTKQPGGWLDKYQ